MANDRQRNTDQPTWNMTNDHQRNTDQSKKEYDKRSPEKHGSANERI